MKYHILFSEKNKKNISKCRLLKILPRVLSVNIVSGRIGPDSVNVDNAVSIGRTQLHTYDSSWPEGFNGALSKNVTTMAVSRKGVKFGTSTVYDTQLIYSRVMGLVSTY